MGEWDAKAASPGTEHVTIAVSGARGGHTVDFRELASRGVTLLGNAGTYQEGTLQVAPNLAKNIANGDANYLSVLEDADAYVREKGLDFPEEPEAHVIAADPPCMTHPVLELNLAAAGITSVIWATGYAMDFGWLEVDAFDAKGRPVHERGVSVVPGLYFVGLSWLSTAGPPRSFGVCGTTRITWRAKLRAGLRSAGRSAGRSRLLRRRGAVARWRLWCGKSGARRMYNSAMHPNTSHGRMRAAAVGRGADRGDVRRRCGASGGGCGAPG